MLATPSKCAPSFEVKIMGKSRAGRLHTAPDMRRQSKEKEEGIFSLLSLGVMSHRIVYPCFLFPDFFYHSGFCFTFSISPDVLMQLSICKKNEYIISSHCQYLLRGEASYRCTDRHIDTGVKKHDGEFCRLRNGQPQWNCFHRFELPAYLYSD